MPWKTGSLFIHRAEKREMADPIDMKTLKSLPVLPYPEVRKKLKSGDLLFTSGDYLVSKAIQQVTKSPWSHVGIVFRLDAIDRVLLLESVEDMGVRFAPLSKYLDDYEDGRPYKGRAVLARCKEVKPGVIEQLVSFGIDELTRPYDKDEIAKILARVALGQGRRQRDREYICSELVYECFRRADIHFGFNPKGFISPEDIWRDACVEMIDRIL